jgi:hypothetical protein
LKIEADKKRGEEEEARRRRQEVTRMKEMLLEE